jgi:hypothetical protein
MFCLIELMIWSMSLIWRTHASLLRYDLPSWSQAYYPTEIIFLNCSHGSLSLLQEFKAFADLRRRLEPLSMAIFAYGKVNGLLTKQDLKRAAQHVRFSYWIWHS